MYSVLLLLAVHSDTFSDKPHTPKHVVTFTHTLTLQWIHQASVAFPKTL